MKYFVMNGCSPHASMWKENGDLRWAKTRSAASLIGITFEQSIIDDVTREKILKRLPDINIPPIRFTVDEDGNRLADIKIIKDVKVDDHIICIYASSGRHVSTWTEDEELVIEDFVVVAGEK